MPFATWRAICPQNVVELPQLLFERPQRALVRGHHPHLQNFAHHKQASQQPQHSFELLELYQAQQQSRSCPWLERHLQQHSSSEQSGLATLPLVASKKRAPCNVPCCALQRTSAALASPASGFSHFIRLCACIDTAPFLSNVPVLVKPVCPSKSSTCPRRYRPPACAVAVALVAATLGHDLASLASYSLQNACHTLSRPVVHCNRRYKLYLRASCRHRSMIHRLKAVKLRSYAHQAFNMPDLLAGPRLVYKTRSRFHNPPSGTRGTASTLPKGHGHQHWLSHSLFRPPISLEAATAPRCAFFSM